MLRVILQGPQNWFFPLIWWKWISPVALAFHFLINFGSIWILFLWRACIYKSRHLSTNPKRATINHNLVSMLLCCQFSLFPHLISDGGVDLGLRLWLGNYCSSSSNCCVYFFFWVLRLHKSHRNHFFPDSISKGSHSYSIWND